MKILVVSKFGHREIIESDSVPFVGCHVDLFYKPRPQVGVVIWRPTAETLKEAGVTYEENIEALVMTD